MDYFVAGTLSGLLAYSLSLLSTPLFNLLQPYFNSWMANPLVNASLIFFEKNKEVFIPLAAAGKQLIQLTVNASLVLLQPVLKLLIAVARAVRPLVLLAFDAIQSLIQLSSSLGVSLGTTVQAMSSQLLELGRSTTVVVKALTYALYYVMRGLSFLINSFDQVFVFSHRALFQTNQITLQELYSVAIPFAVVATVLALLFWPTKSSARNSSPPTITVPRRSSRLARKRAMLMCYDMSNSPPTSKKSSPTTTYL